MGHPFAAARLLPNGNSRAEFAVVPVAEAVTVGVAGGYSDNELDFVNGNDIDHTWRLFLDYDGRINEDCNQHAVSGGVKLSW